MKRKVLQGEEERRQTRFLALLPSSLSPPLHIPQKCVYIGTYSIAKNPYGVWRRNKHCIKVHGFFSVKTMDLEWLLLLFSSCREGRIDCCCVPCLRPQVHFPHKSFPRTGDGGKRIPFLNLFFFFALAHYHAVSAFVAVAWRGGRGGGREQPDPIFLLFHTLEDRPSPSPPPP